VAAETAEAIPLYPRRRLLGSASGGAQSIRRGGRADIASSRPYRPGDHFRTIDWKASARLSSARQSDEFIVRERFADEMPCVVIVVDRRPEMALYPSDLPWLEKRRAVRAAARILIASALSQRALVGYLDDETWEPPRAQASVWNAGLQERLDGYLLEHEFAAPDDTVQRSLEFLATARSSVPLGSFVFVLSDFIAQTPAAAWAHVVDFGWDVVPVIVQDPLWEQSFPEIEGVLFSLADARGTRTRRVRLSADDVSDRRAEHERRLVEVQRDFLRLGLDPIVVSEDAESAVHTTLLAWSQDRLTGARGAF
jgi:uncharacterized protein (DUF58 family)